MTDLKELLERVKAATGPDREIDQGLIEMQGWVRTERKDGRAIPPLWVRALDEDCYFEPEVPETTASIDAALALVEQVLPNAMYRLQSNSHTGGFDADIIPTTPYGGHVEDAATAPLALLAAFLLALSSQEPVSP